jgi:hypothetical protein
LHIYIPKKIIFGTFWTSFFGLFGIFFHFGMFYQDKSGSPAAYVVLHSLHLWILFSKSVYSELETGICKVEKDDLIS